MRVSPLSLCFFMLATTSLPCLAQRGPGGGRGIGASPRPRATPAPDISINQSNVFLSGKVVLEDGSPVTESAAIQTVCKGQKRTETYTDSAGNFSFEFAAKPSMTNGVGVGDADSTSWGGPSGRGNQRSLQDCELSASLAGFSSQIVELSRIGSDQHSDLGRVVLHRLAQVDGLTISATSAAAPDSARKAFEKALKQESKNKLDDAQQSLEKAVEIYARYAVAWYELGRLQFHKDDLPAARHSLDQALAADSKYVSPYRVLAQIAAKEKQWSAVVEHTSKVLALNPINFPDAYFLNALGHYYLREVDDAERSAREGLKLDEEHRFPRFEYLLAVVLVEKHSYVEAADHVRRYIALSTAQPEIEAGKKELAQIETLAPNAVAPAIADKK